NEELKSSNEELLSMNEELQSANEELESSKDELQATNVQLEDTNADLENLLASTGIPTLFLDDAGNVRRVTPTAGRIYNLQVEDVGRPLAHFTSKALAMPALPPSAQVHAGRGAIEHEIELQDGSWYVRRVLPYVTPAGEHEGIVVTFTDITERRRYADEIREREARLRDVIDSMFAFVAVADIDGTLLEVNRGPLEVGGLTREETIGRALWDCAWWTHDEAVRERLREAFGRAVTGEAVRYDEVVRIAGDDRITIDFMLQPVFRDGVLQFVIPSGVDVTHRVNTERELRQQRDLTATITDNATTAILLLDAEGRCTYANPASETMTGYRVDELVGAVLHDRIHHHRADGSEFDAADCAIRHALAAGEDMREHADTFMRKDGSFFPVVCNARSVGSSGLVLEVRDVTRERVKGEALRRRTRELQTLADNSPDILTRFDAECRHVFVNSAVERATGLAASEFIGRTNRDLGMPEVQCDVWEAAIRRVFDTADTVTVEFEFETPEGPRYYSGRFVPELGDDGNVQFALGVTRDRTAERDAELALQEANRRKDVFLATLAHELRNPLAPVRNGLEILRLASNGDERTAAIREIMERQIVNMSRLIDDLLDISRISLGKVELQRGVVSVASVFHGALEVSRPAITAAGHNIAVRQPDEPMLLDADATRMAQVVGNLLQNAAKYTPDGGQITLEALRDGDDVVIRVSDTGIGIERAMLSHVFEMFTQVDHPRAKSKGGLGIGLALVRQLVEMHGGTVRADSDGAGTGSTFTVRLPLASASAPGRPSAVAPSWESTPAGRRTVLVVDDNADAARSLETILTMMGHDACCAFTGAQAIELLESIEPDVVILDIGLPDTSGYELASHIRGELGMTNVLLVALTGWGSEEHRRRSVEAGFDFHLTKPADSAIIRRIMSRALAR
ncbi:MAG: PAS domain S-box protein, partial [Gemmatimonadota bacterium]